MQPIAINGLGLFILFLKLQNNLACSVFIEFDNITEVWVKVNVSIIFEIILLAAKKIGTVSKFSCSLLLDNYIFWNKNILIHREDGKTFLS